MSKLIIQLNIRRPDFSRLVTTEIVDTMADKGALTLRKHLVECQYLGEIAVIDEEARGLAAMTHAPNERFLLDTQLGRLAALRRRLVAKLLNAYPELVKQDKKQLRDLYDPNDYLPKEDLKKQFVFKWRFINT